jgi:hypothetical protein
VTEPENRPPSTNPPGTPPQTKAWISPRLREKLGEAEAGGGGGGGDFEIKKSSPLGPILMFVVTGGVVLGVWWMIHSGQEKAKAEAAKVAASARAEVVADSLARVHQADSLAAVAHADSLAFAALPKAQQKKILAARDKAKAGATKSSTPSSGSSATATTTKPAGGAGTAAKSGGKTAGGASAGASAKPSTGSTAAASEPAPPKESGPYAIDAGQFLDEAKANQVADGLKTTAAMAAKVVTVGGGDAATFHVYLGSFTSRSAAEAKASSLLSRRSCSRRAWCRSPSRKARAP